MHILIIKHTHTHIRWTVCFSGCCPRTIVFVVILAFKRTVATFQLQGRSAVSKRELTRKHTFHTLHVEMSTTKTMCIPLQYTVA